MARKKNSGLGRGLDAIFLENAQIESRDNGAKRITEINVALIDRKSDQPRKYFDEAALIELADSIRENGLLQPILVREIGGGRYQIIAGERRYRASKMAGLEEIPTIILDKTDLEVAQIALIENIQREDLNPIEEALAFRTLGEQYDITQEELAERVGKSRSAIANAVRLLELPEPVVQMVAAKELSAGHARTLLGLKDREDMLLLAEKVVEEGIPVHALAELVKKYNRPKKVKSEDEAELPLVDYTREIELRILRELGRKAEIKERGKKKTLTLYYEDNEDLDDLLSLLGIKAEED